MGRPAKILKKEDIQIERSFLAVMSSDFDSSNLPDHIKYLPRKQAAEYLALSESTLIRYHENGRLKWITRRNRTPIYSREALDNFKENNQDFKSELIFETPNYKVRIGEYKDINVAAQSLEKIRRIYPGSFIIKLSDL